MTRTKERFWFMSAAVVSAALVWWLRGWTINDAVEVAVHKSEVRMWEKFLEVSQSRGLYRLEGMARDDGHDAALEDHEQRIEALEASDE